MTNLIVLFCFLFAVSAYAAEPDPRLVQIQQLRQMLMLQQENAQLSFENAQLRLKELDAMEEKMKTETKDKVKDAK
jgi:regulator of replication initiation timing